MKQTMWNGVTNLDLHYISKYGLHFISCEEEAQWQTLDKAFLFDMSKAMEEVSKPKDYHNYEGGDEEEVVHNQDKSQDDMDSDEDDRNRVQENKQDDDNESKFEKTNRSGDPSNFDKAEESKYSQEFYESKFTETNKSSKFKNTNSKLQKDESPKINAKKGKV